MLKMIWLVIHHYLLYDKIHPCQSSRLLNQVAHDIPGPRNGGWS